MWPGMGRLRQSFRCPGPSHTQALTSAAAQGQEIFFMAILMLHAASIHLHHLYAMPEVNFDVRACGITTGSSMVEVLRAGRSDYYVQTPSQPIIAEDILRRSPFCGCSQVVAAFGAALEVATASNKWQAIAAESNFETSKMVLQRVGKIWPVASVFEQELDSCHGAIQGALEIW
ncbi:hypothetical protein BS47DRAFT_433024 [Hydnum rufescens UP504]|uniref:Uncharacterized protein n=1 Tax=Hydnum rufescens UP504 TaxID=1448309 RepID=A0A9P6AID8_9AGAM|nr:hypothetical protein BS47DRAFT_433024 [Hydnum rufescens UP504]